MSPRRTSTSPLAWLAPTMPLLLVAAVAIAAASCSGAQHPGAAIADELEGEVLRGARAVAAAENTCTDVATKMKLDAGSLDDVPRLARLERAKALQDDCNAVAKTGLDALEAAEATIDTIAVADPSELRCALAKGAEAMKKIRALLFPLGRPMPAIVERALEGAERQGATCADAPSSSPATDASAGGAS